MRKKGMFWPKDLANGTTQSQIRATHSVEILCGCRLRRIKIHRRTWCCSSIRILLECGLSIVRITSLPSTSFFLLHLYHLHPLSPAPPSAFPTPCLPHNIPSSPFLSLSNISLTFHHHRSHSLARIRRPLRLHPRTPRRHSQKHEDPRCNGAEL